MAAKRLEPLTAPYLLVIGIPCFIDSEGRRWTDAHWHKDLVEHLNYIKNLTLASPVRHAMPPQAAKCLTLDQRFDDVQYVNLHASSSELAGILNLPRTFLTLFRATKSAEIIHAGLAEWPIPSGWSATLAARIRGKFLLIYIESAFWRASGGDSWLRKLRAFVWERLNRWCLRRADLALFTQPEYAREMLGTVESSQIIQASWIDKENVLPVDKANLVWNEKQQSKPLRLIFAGQFVPEKGIGLLMDAIENLEVDFSLDFIGDGDLRDRVAGLAARLNRVRLLDPVPYGSAFFELLRQYHAVIVPTQTDEQPRIVYDAFSQAVPVIATRTSGLTACVTDGETGYLSPPADVLELRASIVRADLNRNELRKMGLTARNFAAQFTHTEMHTRRWRLLQDRLSSSRLRPRAV
jgi:glycosyltransferase involved in cell wall biosynthesis